MTTPEDPIERLIGDIAAIRKKVDELAAKAEPATEAQVQKAVKEAKSTPIQLNSQDLAKLILSSLQTSLPNLENLQAISTQHAQAIATAGQQAADQVYQASSRVPRYIGFSDTVFGFTTWKAFLLWMSFIVVSAGGLGYWVSTERARAEQAEAKIEIIENFAHWTIEKYPKVYDAWKKSK